MSVEIKKAVYKRKQWGYVSNACYNSKFCEYGYTVINLSVYFQNGFKGQF